MKYEDNVRRIIDSFKLNLDGAHGPNHWGRVHAIGTYLCERTPGSDLKVANLFALLHDCCRVGEHMDAAHGSRAVTRELANNTWGLTEFQHDMLTTAICSHTSAGPTTNPIIGVCYDSDRLDLLRVGINPHNDFLSTEAAKDQSFQRMCNNNARDNRRPDIVNTWLGY